ncbi:MAG: TerC family protein [Cytophagales bacterium]|nr:TerC family protein [Cytophaga sp.]
MFEPFLTVEGWMSLLTLTIMEIVLGIDNVIFISIISDKLKKDIQAKARFIGLTAALVIRIILLTTISYLVIHLKAPLFTAFNNEISWRDMILIGGGMFLVFKSTTEIYHKVEGEVEVEGEKVNKSLTNAVFQIILLDVVFSFDSILTAVGLSGNSLIMSIAVVLSMIVMIVFSTNISNFINTHPSIKVLALSFLLMIGMMLISQGLDKEIPKEYIYASMVFSLFVEGINMYSGKRNKKKKEAIEKKSLQELEK